MDSDTGDGFSEKIESGVSKALFKRFTKNCVVVDSSGDILAIEGEAKEYIDEVRDDIDTLLFKMKIGGDSYTKKIEVAKSDQKKLLEITAIPIPEDQLFLFLFQIVKEVSREADNIQRRIDTVLETADQKLKYLQNINRRYETIIDAIHDGIWEWNLQTDYIYWSPHWKKTLGYEDSELHGSFDKFKELVHPDDFQAVIDEIYKNLKKRGDHYHVEFRIQHKDGRYLWMRSRGKIFFSEKGEAEILLGSHTDITEERLSQLKYKRLYDSMLEGFASVDSSGKFIDVNQAYLDMLGYSLEELKEINFKDITVDENQFEMQNGENMQMVSKRGYSDLFEKEYIRKDGRRVAVEMRVYALTDSTGEIGGLWALVRDITERKREQIELQKLADRYEVTQSTTKMGSFEHNLSQNRSWWSKETYNIFEFDRDEAVPSFKEFGKIVHPDDLKKFMQNIGKTLQEGVECDMRYRLLFGDRVKYIWGKARIIIDIDGFKKLVGTAQDVTKEELTQIEFQKQKEALEERDEYVLQVFNSTMVAYYIYSFVENRHTFINKRYMTILGYSLEDINSFSSDKFMELFHPDDKDRVLKHMRSVYSSRLGDAHELRYRFRHKDGHWTWCYARGTLLDIGENGTPQTMMGSFFNIDELVKKEIELRNSEARFRAVFDNSVLGIRVLNKRGVTIECNSALSNMLMDSERECENLTLEEFSHSEDIEREKRLFQQLITGEESSATFQKRFIKQDGSTLWTIVHVSTVTPDDEKIYVVQLIQDISEQIELEEKQAKQEQIMFQQSKLAAMGEMIGAIAHQWRQPLTVINGTLLNIEDSFHSGELDEQSLKDHIDYAENSLTYMSNTIDDFRNFFAPTKNRKSFCVEEAVANSISIIYAQLKDHNISISMRSGGLNISNFQRKSYKGECHRVTGYPNEFTQVILNLLANAKDIIIEKRVEDGVISVDIREIKGDVYISVKDNGGGVPEKVIDRIFEPYFTTKEEGKGTGIGLYMSKMIIEDNMDGKLEVENLESGAEFRVVLKSG
jgi:PAS domain S-box-containing protein